MIDQKRGWSWQRWSTSLILVCASILVLLQLQSLSVFPAPNAIRWFGDETWLMTEAKVQITTGVVRYPLALGSTLEHSKGIVLGMTWLSAVLYGLPATLLGSDIIFAGRIVTATLAIVLIGLLFYFARRLGATSLLAAFAALTLISTRAFLFGSHSCRTDLLAGLITLIFVSIAEVETRAQSERTPRWWFYAGLITAFLCVSSSIHLLTLLVPVGMFYCWRLGGFRQWRNAGYAMLGAVAMMLALVGAYVLGSRSLELFSHNASHVQFYDVLHDIPILRPFSRSVQLANLAIRYHQLVEEAPQVFLILVAIVFAFSRKTKSSTLGQATSIVTLSWLLLEGAQPTYLLHVLPLAFLWMAVTISNRGRIVDFVAVPLAFAFSYFAIVDASAANSAGQIIARGNADAAANIVAAIKADWRDQQKPIVLTEPPMLDRLSRDTNIRAVSDHVISFPAVNQPFDSFFRKAGVKYAVLYNSPAYPKQRPINDSFYLAVAGHGAPIAKYVGVAGDIGRDYFNFQPFRDTVLLFRLQ